MVRKSTELCRSLMYHTMLVYRWRSFPPLEPAPCVLCRVQFSLDATPHATRRSFLAWLCSECFSASGAVCFGVVDFYCGFGLRRIDLSSRPFNTCLCGTTGASKLKCGQAGRQAVPEPPRCVCSSVFVRFCLGSQRSVSPLCVCVLVSSDII